MFVAIRNSLQTKIFININNLIVESLSAVGIVYYAFISTSHCVYNNYYASGYFIGKTSTLTVSRCCHGEHCLAVIESY